MQALQQAKRNNLVIIIVYMITVESHNYDKKLAIKMRVDERLTEKLEKRIQKLTKQLQNFKKIKEVWIIFIENSYLLTGYLGFEILFIRTK